MGNRESLEIFFKTSDKKMLNEDVSKLTHHMETIGLDKNFIIDFNNICKIQHVTSLLSDDKEIVSIISEKTGLVPIRINEIIDDVRLSLTNIPRLYLSDNNTLTDGTFEYEYTNKKTDM